MASDVRFFYLAIKKLHQNVSAYSQVLGFSQLASQVAHDIRSPLAALDMILTDLTNISEESRVLIRSATNRIRDIANNLLTQHRENNTLKNSEKKSENFQLTTTNTQHPELISDLILFAVSEKRMQYKNEKVDIQIKIEECTKNLFVTLSIVEFKRIFSNLLNNAIEASFNQHLKKIFVSLNLQKGSLIITIRDEGCGINPILLQKILNGQIVSEKKDGNGLGLSFAKKIIEQSWNGKLEIESQPEKGTSIYIYLSTASTPNWFATKINLSPTQTVVILDDDDSIHNVWLIRFKPLLNKIKLVRFYNEKDFSKWLAIHNSNNLIFLIDYELIGASLTGLEIIERFQISLKSFLVTSRHEEPFVRAQCDKLCVKLIPKSYAISIPINILLDISPQPDYILIDNDTSIVQLWLKQAKIMNKNIITYNNIQCCLKDSMKYNYQHIAIYIDIGLTDDILSQTFLKNLYENGCGPIYLTSENELESCKEISFIKTITRKHPPF